MMSTYQCSVCFYICDLNLEVIEKFQANKDCTICPWKFPEILPGIFGRMVSALSLDYLQGIKKRNGVAHMLILI